MSEKLRVACYGMNGHQIVGRLREHPRASLVAVSEIAPSYLQEHLGAEAAARVRLEPDLQSLIAADDVDLVSLCSPRRDEQAAHAIQCLRAGKHVLAEKPAALTMAELDELQRAASQSKAEFRQMGACEREAVLSAVRRLVDEGCLGTVVQVSVLKSYPYFHARPQDPGVDGGLIRQAGIHGVRFIQLATGLKAVRVCGFETSCGNPGAGGLRMAASIALELQGGALGLLACNYCNPPSIGFWGNDQLRVHGTRGMVEAVDAFQRCTMVLQGSPPQPIPDVPRSYPDFFDSYVELLLDGTPMPYSAEDDLYALRTVIRAQQAVEEGRPLQV